MITREILNFITNKLRSVIYYLIVVGLLFFILAVAILFYPETIQYVFIIAFFALSFMAFLIAIKINNIKEHFNKVLLLIPRKRRSRKKK